MRKHFSSTALATLTVLAIVGFTAPSEASLVGVTSVGTLGTVNTVDWSQLGSVGTVLTSPQNFTSNGGLTGTVSSVGNSFQLRAQGNGWSGNFIPGDMALWTNQVGPDITISLNTPVSGLGAQIQADIYGVFTAQVTAYDLSNTVLGTFSEAGVSNFNNDGSAIFIGLMDSTADIAKLQFTLTGGAGPNDFAISSLKLVSNVPLPAALPLFGSTLLGMGALARRRKKKAAA